MFNFFSRKICGDDKKLYKFIYTDKKGSSAFIPSIFRYDLINLTDKKL